MSNRTHYALYIFGPKIMLDGTVVPHAMQASFGCVIGKEEETKTREFLMANYPTGTELVVEWKRNGRGFSHRKVWTREPLTAEIVDSGNDNRKWTIKA